MVRSTTASASATATIATAASARAKAATGTVDLSLYLLEHLVATRRPVGVTDLAKTFKSSKPTIYRHIQALVKHGFARQDEETSRYEAGIKLLVLGEALRERFNILASARGEMSMLREATGQAVSLSALINDEVITLELLQGRTVVEFGVRPGTKLDLHATAHGKLALAFGPRHLLQKLDEDKLKPWTTDTMTSAADLKKAVAAIRRRGWATAANELVPGVNVLAAPIFDHRDAYAGAIATIGSTHLMGAEPGADIIDLVKQAALRVSRAMGAIERPSEGEQT